MTDNPLEPIEQRDVSVGGDTRDGRDGEGRRGRCAARIRTAWPSV